MTGEKCLLVKTASEISLKSPFVRRFFTKKLVQSIKFALKRNKVECSAITRGGGRLYIFCENPEKAGKVLSTVSGIHATAVAEKFKLGEMEKNVLSFSKSVLKQGDEFALDANTARNKGFSSKDLENRLGAAVMKEIPGLVVRLKNPKKKISVEVREKDFFVYLNQKPGLGGLPSGAEGSVAMFFEGKEEELLAAFLLMHRGCNIFPVVKKKTKALEKHLEKLIPFNDYREFSLTGEKDLEKLIEGRKIKAVATADEKIDGKSLGEYEKFNKEHELIVLRPLLLYPEELGKKFKKILKL